MITLDAFKIDYLAQCSRRSTTLKGSKDWTRLSLLVFRSLSCFDICSWNLQVDSSLALSSDFPCGYWCARRQLPSTWGKMSATVCLLEVVSPKEKDSEIVWSWKTSYRLSNWGFHCIDNFTISLKHKHFMFYTFFVSKNYLSPLMSAKVLFYTRPRKM